MECEFERVELPLTADFTISRGTLTTAENVIVKIHADGETGIGAAAPSTYYGDTAATIEAVLPDLLSVVEDAENPYSFAQIEREMASVIGRNPAAKAGISIALHDLAAKRLGVPLYQLLGLDPTSTITSSYTIGIDTVERVREKTARAIDAGYSVLKLKLGTDQDEKLIGAVRDEAPNARIRVDANEAWTPREAVRKAELLDEHGVEFLEQPVPAGDLEQLKFVFERSPIPIAVDESCVTLSDVPTIADRADVVNIKLMKCGGISEAIRMIHATRAHGLEVMLGCMAASHAAIAASCHLTPLLDYADLDGALVLADDPYAGIPMPGGTIDIESVERPGTGAIPNET